MTNARTGGTDLPDDVPAAEGHGSRYRVFVSHGSNDRWVARRIREGLPTAYVDCFLDETDIELGDNFRTVILDEIEKCHELLVLLTPSSLHRAGVFAEVGAALSKGRRVVAIRFGLDMEELHRRGVVSLIGDTQIIELDLVDSYIEAVTNRARRHVDAHRV
jgi:hypothetical protein